MSVNVKVDIATYNECRDALIEFRNANRESKRDVAYFDWRYRERPNGREAIIVWARDPRGTSVGALSLIPHRFWINGNEQLIGVLGDISVSPTWRGKGIAQNMLQHLVGFVGAQELAGCFVLPNEGAARSLQMAGWDRIAEMHRFVTPTDVTGVVTQRIPAPYGTAVAQLGNWAVRRLRVRALDQQEAPYVCSLVEKVDEKFDDLWARTSKYNVVIAARDRAHLVWRYLQHPLEKYHVAAVMRDGVLSGYVVFRVQQKRCFIDDFLCARWQEEIQQVLASFVESVRTWFEISSVSLRGSVDALGHKTLLTHAWVKRRDAQLVMYRANAVRGGIVSECRRWFITAGDKDT